MKYLNITKLTIGIILIIVGLIFGYKILNLNTRNGNGIIMTGESNASYTPLYAGICIFAGAYLIASIKKEMA
ncbi:hypothetical protein [Mucilaginibacter sp. 3215]|uniref:hypothetical protein n=1 Tax=Mucilaginibacter sp. 3215 TaxID=3373912 RepID=UPI003D211D4A